MKKNTFLFLLILLARFPAHTQFIDVTLEQGIVNVNEGTFDGNGVSFYDFNYDGWDDLTIANGADEPLFLINNQGNYEPVEWSMDIDPPAHIVMMLWSDYDNDGDADLLTTQLGGPLELWNNDGYFSFTEVSDEAGLDNGSWEYWGAAYCDYDHDGCLDLYVAKYYDDDLFDVSPDHRARLYHSNCDGTFTDVTLAAGVQLTPRAVFQPVFFDYNHDGWEDLFLVIDRNAWTNELYLNNQDGTFTNVTVATGLNQAFDAMSGTVDDYDNDGDLDIYVTNGWPGNKLYEHNSDHTFTNIALSAGVTVNLICWAALWLDYDNNTWQDLFVGTTANFFGPAQNHFYLNDQDDTFTQGYTTVGLAGDLSPSFTAAMGDMNNDGYYDFINNQNDLSPTKLWMNDGGENNFLSATLHGTISNRDGIGSWIHCYADGNHYVRYTHCGENLAGQNSAKEIFGLGQIELVDSLVVEWNAGTVDTYYNLQINQHLNLTEGTGYPAPLTVQANPDVVICPGDSATLSAGEFSVYQWSTGEISPSISTGQPGIYSAMLTDEYGIIMFTDSIEVTFADAPGVEVTSIAPSCFGGNNGSAAVMALTPIATIEWSQGDQGNEISGLTSGVYAFAGTTVQGCAFNGEVNISQPDPTSVSVALNHVTCSGGNDGSAQLTISGGTPGYSTDWQNENHLQLAAGQYQVVVTDLNQCISIIQFEIEEPDPIVVETSATDITCFGGNDGSVDVEFFGGTPGYMVDWLGENPFELTSGQHAALVVDALGCSLSFSFIINEPPIIQAETVVTDVACYGGNDGSVELTIAGGTPGYAVDWLGQNPEVLAAGEYEGMITDANNCSLPFLFTIAQPDELSVMLDGTPQYENGEWGTAEVTVQGGSPGFQFNFGGMWTTSNTANNLAAGTYDLEVLDAHGCTISTQFTIGFVTSIPEINGSEFSLHPNPFTNTLKAALPAGGGPFVLRLFDLCGRIVFQQDVISNNATLWLQGLEKGCYLAVLTDTQNLNHYQQQVLKGE